MLSEVPGYSFQAALHTAEFAIGKKRKTRENEVTGWLRLDFPASRQEPSVRLSFFGEDVLGPGTGTLDLQVYGAVTVERANDRFFVKASDLAARLLYQRLVDDRGYRPLSEGGEKDVDLFATPPDILVGTISGMAQLHRPPRGEPVLEWNNIGLELVARNTGPVKGITMTLDNVTTEIALDPTQQDGNEYPCPNGGATPKQLPVQLVLCDETAESFVVATDQLAAAQAMWDPACITFVQQLGPIHLANISDADKKDPEALAAKYTAGNGIIPIFLVGDNLLGYGGGVCFNPGTALGKVVISTHVTAQINGFQITNHWLLAHELGHVLSGYHPSANPLPLWWDPGVARALMWQGDQDTVLQPSGSASNPVSQFNSLYNCWAAWFTPNPAVLAA